MKSARTRASPARPGWWLRTLGALRRVLLLAPSRQDGRFRVSDAPELGPREVEAVEKALGQWVRRQKAESTTVPARRIDSD